MGVRLTHSPPPQRAPMCVVLGSIQRTHTSPSHTPITLSPHPPHKPDPNPQVRIQTRQREALEGKRLLVAVDAWPATSRYPVGHYVKTLGAVGDKDVETEVGG
jgi:hypothetical protein